MSTNTALECIGPFDRYRLTVDGYEVPFLSGFKKDGMLHLRLDNSWALDVPEFYALPVVNFIANAMAYAAGYTCFGEGSKPLNQYQRRLSQIDLSKVENGTTHVAEISEPQ